MNVKALMKRFLEEEGFKYEWGEECTCFRFQGLNVNVLFYDNIEDLLSLAVSFDTELPRYVALDLCNELNQTNILKHYLIDDDTLVVLFDELKPEVEVSNESVMNNLELLVRGAITCRNRMNEQISYLTLLADKTVN